LKFTRPRKLMCKGGLLEIRPDGLITSTKDQNSPYGKYSKALKTTMVCSKKK